MIKPENQTPVFGEVIGGPVCGRKLLPLVMPLQPTEAASASMRDTAKKCDKYGLPVEAFKSFGFADTVSLADVGFDADPTAPDAGTTPPTIRGCGTCVHYVRPEVVKRATGWNLGLCRASGNLLLGGLARRYDLECGRFATDNSKTAATMNAFQLNPIYLSTFGKVDLAKEYLDGMVNLVDPRVWPNERGDSIGSKAAARGIRAWRRIVDPSGYADDLFLPIYDWDAKGSDGSFIMPQQLRHLVPQTGDKEHPEEYADHGANLFTMAVMMMKVDATPAFWGAGGTGKTEFARHLAWMMQLPFHRLSITARTDVDELAGTTHFEKGETKFHYGQMPTAFMNPGIILLDEPNTGPPEVWQFLRPLTDNGKRLIMTMHKGEYLDRHLDCWLMMAMNPVWDPRNVGTTTIGDADMRRLAHMAFDYPPPEIERAIIQQRCISEGWPIKPKQLDGIMGATKELRKLSEDGSISTTWGPAHNIKVAGMLCYFEPTKAYRHALTDALDPSELDAVSGVISSHFEVA
jgi:hypothetical protein